MIVAATGHLAAERRAWPERLGLSGDSLHTSYALGGADAFALVRRWAVPSLDREERTAIDPKTGSWLALSGHVFAEAGGGDPSQSAAGTLLRRLGSNGIAGLADFDGTFAIAFWDAATRRLTVARDAFGVEPLFCAERNGDVAFASRVRDLAATGVPIGRICPQGLVEFLTWGYTPGEATLDDGVVRVPPGCFIAAEPGRGIVARGRWYRLSFASPVPPDPTAIGERFRELLTRAVARREGERPVGVFLSGGMDSSSVASVLGRAPAGSLRTFGFRCAGATFDESHYARALAEELGAQHTEVMFGERDAMRKEEAVREMDVPFCDIGIVTASWLLGEAAGNRVDHVLTGDGGDELWGSHPVYAAQRLFSLWDRLPIPRAMTLGLRRAADRLRDSSQKRDLRVKLKRILPADGLPRELGAFRWRALGGPAAIRSLLSPEAAALVRDCDPFRPVLDAYAGYDGPDDGLSAHLYADYATASGFYFARLRLIRRFGVEARCPFYDRDLVEFGARIPARLKLERIETTKRLFREAMRGVLPEVIRQRTDKLGHSVPLKNWLRSDGPLAARVAEVLAPGASTKRGIFRPDAMRILVEEHRAMRHNHSHRIWAAYVLESWLRAREA